MTPEISSASAVRLGRVALSGFDGNTAEPVAQLDLINYWLERSWITPARVHRRAPGLFGRHGNSTTVLQTLNP